MGTDRAIRSCRVGPLLLAAYVAHGPPRHRFPRLTFHRRGRTVGVSICWRLSGLTVGARPQSAPPATPNRPPGGTQNP